MGYELDAGIDSVVKIKVVGIGGGSQILECGAVYRCAVSGGEHTEAGRSLRPGTGTSGRQAFRF